MGGPRRDSEELYKKIITLLAENKMNISEVARILRYDRNTVKYHIGQIKKATGKDPLNLFELAELIGMVKVERCRDCFHYKKYFLFSRIVYECEEYETDTGADGYCHKGIRREKGE